MLESKFESQINIFGNDMLLDKDSCDFSLASLVFELIKECACVT